MFKATFGMAFVVLVVLLVGAASFKGFGWLSAPMDKKIEREVMINSHQYIEGNNSRMRMLQAQIVGIDEMIRDGEGDPASLKSQKRSLQAMLRATQR